MLASSGIMTALLLLTTFTCLAVSGSASHEGTSGSSSLESGLNWLWEKRRPDWGWGPSTSRVALALAVAGHPQMEQGRLERELVAKQVELDLVVQLWRHHEAPISPGQLSLYAMALSALCKDPRDFHGHDLIASLQRHDPSSDFEKALASLATCRAGAHVRRRQVRRLLQAVDSEEIQHKVDTFSIALTALGCAAREARHRHLAHSLRSPLQNLASLQRPDGSFGNLYSTTLAIQALTANEGEDLVWNSTAAKEFLTQLQEDDGSFKDEFTTSEAVLGLYGKGLGADTTANCLRPPTTEETKETENEISLGENGQTEKTDKEDHKKAEGPSNSAALLEEFADISETNSSTLATVNYWLWLDSNITEIHSITLHVPLNTSFFKVMMLAAENDPSYEFSSSVWPNGHYVHTIGGRREQAVGFYFWLLYKLPGPPDPEKTPGNELVAPAGVDDLLVQDGDNYLFWYKKI